MKTSPGTNSQHEVIECLSCGYAGRVLMAHHGYKWWALPAGFLAACSGIGLIPLAIGMIILGNRTYAACPKCKSRDHIPAKGKLWPTSLEIWNQAHTEDELKFKRNKWILFGVTMTILAAALTFCLKSLR